MGLIKEWPDRENLTGDDLEILKECLKLSNLSINCSFRTVARNREALTPSMIRFIKNEIERYTERCSVAKQYGIITQKDIYRVTNRIRRVENRLGVEF